MATETIPNATQQIQELQQANQHRIAKLNEISAQSRWSFYALLILHLVVLLVGLLLLILGIYAAFKDKALLGTMLILGGGAEIVYFLWTKPIQELQATLGNMLQMEVALGGWFQEMSHWQTFLQNTRIQDQQAVVQSMRDATKWTIMLIEDYCSGGNELTTLEKEESDSFANASKAFLDKLKKAIQGNTSQQKPVEPPKTEPKAEPPKTEPAKAEPPKTEPKAEPPKTEPAKAEPPKTEPAKAEPPKVEPPEQPKTEPPKTEPAKAELPKTEPKTEPPKVELPKTEPKTEPPKAEPPKAEPSKTELPK